MLTSIVHIYQSKTFQVTAIGIHTVITLDITKFVNTNESVCQFFK